MTAILDSQPPLRAARIGSGSTKLGDLGNVRIAVEVVLREQSCKPFRYCGHHL